MALDSRDKRASAIGVRFSHFHLGPNPDGSFDQADRQQMGTIYRGILVAGVVAIAWFNGLTTSARLTGVGA